MHYKTVKAFLARFRSTPIHPQWFVYRGERKKRKEILRWMKGIVLDIGCADGRIKQFLPENVSYIGLDYYTTAVNWYNTRPDIFGDAHDLPIASGSIDSVLLLDVLEHLHDPEKALSEVARVLTPGGVLYLQVPFMYPEHDAPLDYQRWTQNGIRYLGAHHSFDVCSVASHGKPVETAVLMFNIAVVKTLLTGFRKKNLVLVITPLVPIMVLLANLFGFIWAYLSYEDEMMAHGHSLVLRKR